MSCCVPTAKRKRSSRDGADVQKPRPTSSSQLASASDPTKLTNPTPSTFASQPPASSVSTNILNALLQSTGDTSNQTSPSDLQTVVTSKGVEQRRRGSLLGSITIARKSSSGSLSPVQSQAPSPSPNKGNRRRRRRSASQSSIKSQDIVVIGSDAAYRIDPGRKLTDLETAFKNVIAKNAEEAEAENAEIERLEKKADATSAAVGATSNSKSTSPAKSIPPSPLVGGPLDAIDESIERKKKASAPPRSRSTMSLRGAARPTSLIILPNSNSTATLPSPVTNVHDVEHPSQDFDSIFSNEEDEEEERHRRIRMSTASMRKNRFSVLGSGSVALRSTETEGIQRRARGEASPFLERRSISTKGASSDSKANDDSPSSPQPSLAAMEPTPKPSTPAPAPTPPPPPPQPVREEDALLSPDQLPERATKLAREVSVRAIKLNKERVRRQSEAEKASKIALEAKLAAEAAAKLAFVTVIDEIIPAEEVKKEPVVALKVAVVTMVEEHVDSDSDLDSNDGGSVASREGIPAINQAICSTESKVSQDNPLTIENATSQPLAAPQIEGIPSDATRTSTTTSDSSTPRESTSPKIPPTNTKPQQYPPNAFKHNHPIQSDQYETDILDQRILSPQESEVASEAIESFEQLLSLSSFGDELEENVKETDSTEIGRVDSAGKGERVVPEPGKDKSFQPPASAIITVPIISDIATTTKATLPLSSESTLSPPQPSTQNTKPPINPTATTSPPTSPPQPTLDASQPSTTSSNHSGISVELWINDIKNSAQRPTDPPDRSYMLEKPMIEATELEKTSTMSVIANLSMMSVVSVVERVIENVGLDGTVEEMEVEIGDRDVEASRPELDLKTSQASVVDIQEEVEESPAKAESQESAMEKAVEAVIQIGESVEDAASVKQATETQDSDVPMRDLYSLKHIPSSFAANPRQRKSVTCSTMPSTPEQIPLQSKLQEAAELSPPEVPEVQSREVAPDITLWDLQNRGIVRQRRKTFQEDSIAPHLHLLSVQTALGEREVPHEANLSEESLASSGEAAVSKELVDSEESLEEAEAKEDAEAERSIKGLEHEVHESSLAENGSKAVADVEAVAVPFAQPAPKQAEIPALVPGQIAPLVLEEALEPVAVPAAEAELSIGIKQEADIEIEQEDEDIAMKQVAERDDTNGDTDLQETEVPENEATVPKQSEVSPGTASFSSLRSPSSSIGESDGSTSGDLEKELMDDGSADQNLSRGENLSEPQSSSLLAHEALTAGDKITDGHENTILPAVTIAHPSGQAELDIARSGSDIYLSMAEELGVQESETFHSVDIFTTVSSLALAGSPLKKEISGLSVESSDANVEIVRASLEDSSEVDERSMLSTEERILDEADSSSEDMQSTETESDIDVGNLTFRDEEDIEIRCSETSSMRSGRSRRSTLRLSKQGVFRIVVEDVDAMKAEEDQEERDSKSSNVLEVKSTTIRRDWDEKVTTESEQSTQSFAPAAALIECVEVEPTPLQEPVPTASGKELPLKDHGEEATKDACLVTVADETSLEVPDPFVPETPAEEMVIKACGETAKSVDRLSEVPDLGSADDIQSTSEPSLVGLSMGSLLGGSRIIENSAFELEFRSEAGLEDNDSKEERNETSNNNVDEQTATIASVNPQRFRSASASRASSIPISSRSRQASMGASSPRPTIPPHITVADVVAPNPNATSSPTSKLSKAPSFHETVTGSSQPSPSKQSVPSLSRASSVREASTQLISSPTTKRASVAVKHVSPGSPKQKPRISTVTASESTSPSSIEVPAVQSAISSAPGDHLVSARIATLEAMIKNQESLIINLLREVRTLKSPTSTTSNYTYSSSLGSTSRTAPRNMQRRLSGQSKYSKMEKSPTKQTAIKDPPQTRRAKLRAGAQSLRGTSGMMDEENAIESLAASFSFDSMISLKYMG
ncbi:hypothetical protein HDU97_003522 [Phlyctochytrium planicorne]|nr:hypothetical protein HDU97_003522 [Phlyctochytrium planicorne]